MYKEKYIEKFTPVTGEYNTAAHLWVKEDKGFDRKKADHIIGSGPYHLLYCQSAGNKNCLLCFQSGTLTELGCTSPVTK